MAERAEPLINVKEQDTFLEDQMTVSNALAATRRFAKKPFADRREAGEAAQAIKDLKGAKRDAEKRKLALSSPYRATTDSINANYNELLSPVVGAIQALEDKGLAFLRAEKARADEKRRQEQEEIDRKAEEAAAEAQKAAEEAARAEDEESRRKAQEARQAAAEAAVATPAPPLDPPKRLRGAAAVLSPIVKWHYEVTDVSQLPAELTEVVTKEATIKALVDAEAKASKAEARDFNLEIPGVRIYSKEHGMSR
jgi:hypothetical protein